ncbi:M16 family metallopeptidase [Pseudofulvibacter geojedonensis]|uniref:M16 family metallopeptidase n=1 Tax=Pseudofulvibacter geojedonensis TaxID=1123758 RepID=A0ABW3I1T7_9FLAO
MKKIYNILALVFIGMTTMHAQVDRSKQPVAGPAPTINIEAPKSFKLSNGLEVMVVENNKLPRVSVSLTIDNPPVLDGDKAGVSSLTSAMLGKGSKSVSKDVFNEEVDYMGANMNLSSRGGFASGLSKYFNRLVEMMADAAINPNFTQEEFDKEKEKILEGIKSEEKNVKAAADRVKYLLAYGKNHPYGEYESAQTVGNVNLSDVNKFYQNYFVPDNAYMVVVGDVKFKDVKKAVTKNFSNWRKGLAPSITYPKAQNVQFTQINFIDMPNAVQSEISVVSTVDFKMNDEDYHAALIANKILGGGFNSMLNLNLREANGWTYGARSSLRAERDAAALFTAGASVRNAVTDSAVVETLKEINNIRTVNVTEDQLKNVKAKYLGDFVLAMEKPQTIARYALNIKRNKLDKDFYKTFLSKINAVTVEDVKRVANKYFLANNLRVVIAGKGSEVVEALERVQYNGKKLPIKYFDKYGNATERPVFSKPIPKGVTAKTVIENYIKAVGGEEKLASVKTLHFTGDFNAMGQTMKLNKKQMIPNKELQEVLHPQAGPIFKQVFDGEKGYSAQMGQQKPLEGEDLEKSKAKKNVLFEELVLDISKATLESVVSINGEDAYLIKVGDESRFYNAKSGYLVKVEETIEAQGQKVSVSTEYSNYTPTNGVQFPFSVTIKQGPQTFGMIIKEVKVNEGVTEADFK